MEEGKLFVQLGNRSSFCLSLESIAASTDTTATSTYVVLSTPQMQEARKGHKILERLQPGKLLNGRDWIVREIVHATPYSIQVGIRISPYMRYR